MHLDCDSTRITQPSFSERSETAILAVSITCGPGVIGLLAVIEENRTAALLYLCNIIVKDFYGFLLWKNGTKDNVFFTRLAWLLLTLALELYITAVRWPQRRVEVYEEMP